MTPASVLVIPAPPSVARRLDGAGPADPLKAQRAKGGRMICGQCGDEIEEGGVETCCGTPFHANGCYDQHLDDGHDEADDDE